MRELLHGRLDRDAYCALLRNLHAIYAALESALVRNAAHPAVAAVALPGLERRAALAADLGTLHGERWANAIGLAAATADYVRRVDDLAAHRPELLPAHAYVRYLGDLNGGRILRRIVARSFGLADGAGVAFYEFGRDAGGLAARFRAGLDAVTGDAADATGAALADALVAEAQAAFARHAGLFEELAATAPRARSQPPLA